MLQADACSSGRDNYKGRDVGGGGSDECKFKDVPVERAALASYCCTAVAAVVAVG